MEKTKLQPYSVLMSVYAGDEEGFLRECLDSLMQQTVPADEIVLVCDGPLNEELDKAISDYQQKLGGMFKVHRLAENMGTAYAANYGLERCENELIMKMDPDDICLPERAELQLTFLAEHPGIDMVGGYIEEFKSSTKEHIAIRKTPASDIEIRRFAKRRTPFNNQTMIYKKSLAMQIGGYSNDLRRCEDYDFMVRMLIHGAKGANLPQILVRYRVNYANLARRRNLKNTKSFIAVRKKIHRLGYSSFWDYLVPCVGQVMLFITPGVFTGYLYKTVLRKK
ncbi:MAG: glycosyltransferase [Eubacterium sp.]|nr:glycosyltransferase [Eubacterium sp.]